MAAFAEGSGCAAAVKRSWGECGEFTFEGFSVDNLFHCIGIRFACDDGALRHFFIPDCFYAFDGESCIANDKQRCGVDIFKQRFS